jgi:hypothetical protein
MCASTTRPHPTKWRHTFAHVQGAAQAVRDQDIEGIVGPLSAGVALYEQHPSYVHEVGGLLRDLLVFIRSTRSLCRTLGRRDDDFAQLEARAEALRAELH